MKIKQKAENEGKTYEIEYQDCDTFDNLPTEKCTQTYGVCFYKNEIVIVRDKDKNRWGLVGGGIEEGETLEEALIREVKEESNMKVLKSIPIGYQKVIGSNGNFAYQLRSYCEVEPYGPFVEDLDGDIVEIKLINPLDYKKYFDWKEIGERIIERAIEIHKKLF